MRNPDGTQLQGDRNTANGYTKQFIADGYGPRFNTENSANFIAISCTDTNNSST